LTKALDKLIAGKAQRRE